jgi:hypothetical protein
MDDTARIREEAAARVKERADAWNARVERKGAEINDRIARVQFLQEEAHRLCVLLDKGQNMFAAFFAELENLRPRITDEVLGDWCFWNLGISLNSLHQIAKIFDDADADRTRASLKKARLLAQEQAAAEKARAAAEKAAQRAAEDEARRQREAEKAAETAEAERRAALAQTRIGSSQKISRELIEEIKNRMLAHKPSDWKNLMQEFGVTERIVRNAVEQARGEIRAEARLAGIVPPPPKRRDSRDILNDLSEHPPVERAASAAVADEVASPNREDLAKAIHAALARVSRIRSEWIEATLELASKLRQARERSPNNIAFSAWLNANDIAVKISPQDRSALMGMARDLAATRAELERTRSWSWQLVWKEINHPSSIRRMVNGDLDAPSQALH